LKDKFDTILLWEKQSWGTPDQLENIQDLHVVRNL